MSNEILYIGIKHFIVFINDDQSCFDLIREKKIALQSKSPYRYTISFHDYQIIRFNVIKSLA